LRGRAPRPGGRRRGIGRPRRRTSGRRLGLRPDDRPARSRGADRRTLVVVVGVAAAGRRVGWAAPAGPGIVAGRPPVVADGRAASTRPGAVDVHSGPPAVGAVRPTSAPRVRPPPRHVRTGLRTVSRSAGGRPLPSGTRARGRAGVAERVRPLLGASGAPDARTGWTGADRRPPVLRRNGCSPTAAVRDPGGQAVRRHRGRPSPWRLRGPGHAVRVARLVTLSDGRSGRSPVRTRRATPRRRPTSGGRAAAGRDARRTRCRVEQTVADQELVGGLRTRANRRSPSPVRVAVHATSSDCPGDRPDAGPALVVVGAYGAQSPSGAAGQPDRGAPGAGCWGMERRPPAPPASRTRPVRQSRNATALRPACFAV
jgi:hypothetical protein